MLDKIVRSLQGVQRLNHRRQEFRLLAPLRIVNSLCSGPIGNGKSFHSEAVSSQLFRLALGSISALPEDQ